MTRNRIITRRRLKWACVVLIVATTLVLLASIGRWSTIGLQLSDGSGVAIECIAGGLVFLNADEWESVMPSIAAPLNLHTQPAPLAFQFLPFIGRPNTTTYVFVPLWIPIVCLGGFAIWLHRTDARRLPGHCRGCGYDLGGLKDVAVCPECGKSAAAKP